MTLSKIGIAVLAFAVVGTVHARGISVDGYSVYTPGTGTSVSTSIDGVAIDFAPGTSQTAYTLGSYGPGTYNPTWGPSVEYGWEPLSGQPALPLIFAEQVQIYPTSASDFTIYFNYAAASCAGETASFTVSGTTYKSANPCSVSGKNGGEAGGAPPDEGSGNDFVVDKGKVVTIPAGWTAQTTAKAPEMSSSSAVAALTLLMGLVAVLRGRLGSWRRAATSVGVV
jgi:hypothetical protein